MATTRIHTCTYFDDGGPELLCCCGARGLYLVEDGDTDALLVALLDDAPIAGSTREDFAISA
ncbi:hypothetical protein [uncultured Cellulomonas sp.]|uniref:hypothetical protein n=1 Tax=uncultured Cellulomonas sp. TaxID=189682 RepID=UPI00261B6129|nr:hypothetical protein [uncultured Cellulomonas sp.]